MQLDLLIPSSRPYRPSPLRPALAANLLAGIIPQSHFSIPKQEEQFPHQLYKREKGENSEIPGYTLAAQPATKLSENSHNVYPWRRRNSRRISRVYHTVTPRKPLR